MARITKSKEAPEGEVNFTLVSTSFSLDSASSSFESDDPVIVADAVAHPFLEVKDEGDSTPAAAAENVKREPAVYDRTEAKVS
jgi:hypothetical protein